MNIATLSRLTESAGAGFDYKAFQMPTAILLAALGLLSMSLCFGALRGRTRRG